jgi:hypothetical protein
MATKIRMKSSFSMSDCNTGKKLSRLTVKINARKGHTFRQPKPVSYHVDMHSIAKSHFDEAVSWGDVTQYVKAQSVSQLINPGPRGTGNNKPSPNPGHPQEPVRKSGRDTLGAEQHASLWQDWLEDHTVPFSGIDYCNISQWFEEIGWNHF